MYSNCRNGRYGSADGLDSRRRFQLQPGRIQLHSDRVHHGYATVNSFTSLGLGKRRSGL